MYGRDNSTMKAKVKELFDFEQHYSDGSKPGADVSYLTEIQKTNLEQNFYNINRQDGVTFASLGSFFAKEGSSATQSVWTQQFIVTRARRYRIEIDNDASLVGTVFARMT